MQIVQDLGGYTLGRADLVRRAMSKKKESVMQKERANFVYGNPEEGVPGCIARGIPEEIANTIFDEMTDFASYAFNKSHAAVYGVVSYQTAYLKCYYPVEFMAALLTSVIDKGDKVADYIQTCRSMGIEILPPDINRGQWTFSVDDGRIRYGLASIKGLGRAVVEIITAEREAHGPFTSLKDLIDRLSSKEINKRTMENFILSGALDSLPGNRKQKMYVYGDLMDAKARTAREDIAGQVSLFDLMGDEERARVEITMPDVPEYDRRELLQKEKETLGVYITGHPMQDVSDLWERYATAKASGFVVDEESGNAEVMDGQIVTMGGIITGLTRKITKNGQLMAFLTVEDLTGSIEVLVFPRDYERMSAMLVPDRRIFMRGRVSIGDDPVGKLVMERAMDIDEWPQELWVKFPSGEVFERFSGKLLQLAAGRGVTAWIEDEKTKRVAPAKVNELYTDDDLYRFEATFGEDNVRLTRKNLEEVWKMR